jgi:hypothetical protein
MELVVRLNMTQPFSEVSKNSFLLKAEAVACSVPKETG